MKLCTDRDLVLIDRVANKRPGIERQMFIRQLRWRIRCRQEFLLQMLRLAGNAPNQMTDTVKIDPRWYLAINQVAHKSRFASFFGGGRRLSASRCFLGRRIGESISIN